MAGRTRTLHPTCRDDSPTQKLPSTRRPRAGNSVTGASGPRGHLLRVRLAAPVPAARPPRAPPGRAGPSRAAGTRPGRPRHPRLGARDSPGEAERRAASGVRAWARVGCGSRNPPHTCTAGAGRVTCGWNCGAGGPGMPCDCSSMVRGAGASALCRKGKVTVSKVIAAARADPPGAPGGPPGQPVPTPAAAGPQRWSPN